MKNKIQKFIKNIKTIFYNNLLCVSLKKNTNTKDKELHEKEKCGKIGELFKKIFVMIIQTTDSSYKDNNQNFMYLFMSLIGLTVANTQFNDKADKQSMFYLSIVLVIGCLLCLWFINRQSKRHGEYHRRKQKFLLDKMSENDYGDIIIKPEIKNILRTQYLNKLNDTTNINFLVSDIFNRYGEDLKNTVNAYQKKYVISIFKLKLKTLTEKFDWEYFGKTIALIEFILCDLGRFIALLFWLILFIKANYNIISCN